MRCPTCEPNHIMMTFERQEYGNGLLLETWECHVCGTTATTRTPCVVNSVGVDSAAPEVPQEAPKP